MPNQDHVETVATAIAETVGSTAFSRSHFRDTEEWRGVRDKFRDLAEQAIALTLDEARHPS